MQVTLTGLRRRNSLAVISMIGSAWGEVKRKSKKVKLNEIKKVKRHLPIKEELGLLQIFIIEKRNIFRTILLGLLLQHTLISRGYITSYYNHLAPGDYSRVTKFQNGCLTFCHWFQGSDKLNRRKFNWEEHKICYHLWQNTFQKKDMKFLLIELHELAQTFCSSWYK